MFFNFLTTKLCEFTNSMSVLYFMLKINTMYILATEGTEAVGNNYYW